VIGAIFIGFWRRAHFVIIFFDKLAFKALPHRIIVCEKTHISLLQSLTLIHIYTLGVLLSLLANTSAES
jgi:hypothetical protein